MRSRRTLTLCAAALLAAGCTADAPTAVQPGARRALTESMGHVDADGHYIVPLFDDGAHLSAATISPAGPPLAPGGAQRSIAGEPNDSPEASGESSGEGAATNPVANGGFETNGGARTATFASWGTANQGSGAWYVQTGTTVRDGVAPVPAPPEGAFAAMTGQPGPGAHLLFQDVAVPAGGATLLLDLYIANRANRFVSPPTLSHVAAPNQQFRIDVMDPSAPIADVGTGVLARLFRTEPGDRLVWPGYEPRSFSLDAFAGRTVRLRFAQVDNQLFFNVGLDNVRIVAANTPPAVVGLRAEPADSPYSVSAKACGGRFTVCVRFQVADADGAADAPFRTVVDWGDGSAWLPNTVPAATSLLAPHDYAEPGTYEVKVTATDRRGAATTEAISLVVTP